MMGEYVDGACQDPAGARAIGVKSMVERLRSKLAPVFGQRQPATV
jgi:hypothetical protein